MMNGNDFLNYITNPNNSMEFLPSIFSQQIRNFYINGTATGEPNLEAKIVEETASYGKQLGWLLEALVVIAQKLEEAENVSFTKDQLRAIFRLYDLHDAIEKLKERSGKGSGKR